MKPETKFIRSFIITKDDHIIKGTAQPYIVGIYIAIEDTKITQLIQLTPSHKQWKKESKKLFQKFEKDGYKIESVEANYGDFMNNTELDYIKQI